jgi:alkylation response protein AidB-like acyl-CoA dehydrogenase
MPDTHPVADAAATELKGRAAAREPTLDASAAATEELRRLLYETIAELKAAAQVDAARLMMERDTRQAMAAMHAGRELGDPERVRNRRDQAYLVRECRAVVDRLFTTRGGQGIFLDNALQHKFRDMHAMSGRFALNWDVAATTYGRVALGLEPTTHLR